jgi:hypothetical protein
MRSYFLQCLDRDTGKETVVRIPATDEQAAIQQAVDRGLAVAKVLRVDDAGSSEVRAPSESKGVFGLVLAIVGLALIVLALAWPQSLPSANTVNLALLNIKLLLGIIGGALLIVGVVMRESALIRRTIRQSRGD